MVGGPIVHELSDTFDRYYRAVWDKHRRIEEAGGKLELRAGRLVVHLPPEALGLWGNAAKVAAQRLYAAEAVVAACLREKREMPDAETTSGGAVRSK